MMKMFIRLALTRAAVVAMFLAAPVAAFAQLGPTSLQAPPPITPRWLPKAHPHVAGVGDSFMNQAFFGTDLTNGILPSGNVSLANVLSGQSMYIDPQFDNFTVGGAGMANVLAQTPAIIARHPDVIIIQCCHNDIIASILALGANPTQSAAKAAALASVNSDFATMKTVVANFQAVGIMPVLVLENLLNCDEISQGAASGNIPACVANPGVTYLNVVNGAVIQQNDLRRDWAIRNGIPTSDWFTPTVAQQGVTIGGTGGYTGINSTYTEDNIHPDYPGNFAIAKQMLVDLAPYLGNPTGALAATASDNYDSVNNPYGNLYPNGLNYSYAACSGGCSGQIAGNWPSQWAGYYQTNISTGKVITGSIFGGSGNPGQYVNIAVSGTGTAGNSASAGLNIYTVISTTFSAPVQVECWERVAVTANSPFTQINMSIAPGGGGGNSSNGNPWYNVGVPGTGYPLYTAGPTTAWTGIIHAPPVTVPPNTTITVYHNFGWNDSAGTFTGTLQLSQFTCRQVPAGTQF